MPSNIKEFYNNNYKSFDASRNIVWEKVKEFLKDKKGSYILDAGCGNGKDMKYMIEKGIRVKGMDLSENLVDLCKSKELDVSLGDIRKIPFEDNVFDYTISLAVIHHLNSLQDIMKSIDEMLRVSKIGVFFSVWAFEGNEGKFSIGDNFVKWGSDKRYYNIFDKKSLEELISKYDVKDYYLHKGNWFVVLNA